MLAAYLDASGMTEGDWAVIGGFVGEADKWITFERDWAELLAEPRYARKPKPAVAAPIFRISLRFMDLPFVESAAYSKHFAGGRSVPIDVRFSGDDNHAMQHRRIASTAAMLADPSRAAMVLALMDGRSRSAKKLALDAGVTPQTASAHLKKLVAANILLWQGSGREKYFRIAGREVAQAVEALSELGGGPLTAAAREIRFARCCYDHLAGQLGVCVTERLMQPGNAVLANLGIDLQGLESSRRPLFRCCTDWTERRPHIAGALGAALLHHYKECRWLVPVQDSRKLEVTSLGRAMFVRVIGVEEALFGA